MIEGVEDASTKGDNNSLGVVDEVSKTVDVCSSGMLDSAAKGLEISTIGDDVFWT